MAPAANTSTTCMPRALLIAAVLLLVARVAVWATTSSGQNSQGQMSSIQWTAIKDCKLDGAAAADKLILYKFSAAWSDPCQRLETEVLVNHKVSDLAKSSFVPIVVEDRVREDGKNTEQIADLQKRYHVFAFPTLVIADADGKSKGVLVGCSSSLATYRFLARAAQTNASTARHK